MTDTAAASIHNPAALFIGGEWIEPSTSARFDVIDSATENVFASEVWILHGRSVHRTCLARNEAA